MGRSSEDVAGMKRDDFEQDLGITLDADFPNGHAVGLLSGECQRNRQEGYEADDPHKDL